MSAALPFDELAARLAAEGITTEEFVRELFDGDGYYPDDSRLAWLGRVEEVDRDHHNATSQELEHETVVFHLPAHGLYLRTHGVNEPDAHDQPAWDYDPLRPCQPEQQTHTYTIYV
jgi:hypothetical protein